MGSMRRRYPDCNYGRCKYVVQVVIGEQRGEGVRYASVLLTCTYDADTERTLAPVVPWIRRMGCRCFWDSETDCYASETFSNVRTELSIELDSASA